MKIGIIGHFGEGKNLLNGQTIKTKIITEELQRQFGKEQVLTIDTHGGAKTLLKAPLHVLSVLKTCENVIIFPAHNGLRVYAPLLVFLNILHKRKLHYVVIGGWLPSFLQRRNFLKKCLERFDGIYVETSTMQKVLKEKGLQNIFVMPNCKKITILSEDELVYPVQMPYKLCTFSRVMREKGIEDAVKAVTLVNEKLGYQAFALDIYGQIDMEQSVWFEKLQGEFPEFIHYGGTVPYSKSVEVLKDYFALLFPTYYEGEGFAGTLLDAFSSGVPVIASDWKFNSEIVDENVGYVYPTGEIHLLVDVLEKVALNPTMLINKKNSCLKEAEKYKIDNVVQILIEQLDGVNSECINI